METELATLKDFLTIDFQFRSRVYYDLKYVFEAHKGPMVSQKQSHHIWAAYVIRDDHHAIVYAPLRKGSMLVLHIDREETHMLRQKYVHQEKQKWRLK